MATGSSSVLHNLVNTFGVDLLPSENPLTAILEITTASVSEGSPIQGKVKRQTGPVDTAFTVRVTLTGIPAANLPIGFAPIDVTVAEGTNEASFSFGTIDVIGTVDCVGTLTLTGTGVILGTPHVGTFNFVAVEVVPPGKPVVKFTGMLPGVPEIDESPDHTVYYRVNIERTVPAGTTDEGLTVKWAKTGYVAGDTTRWATSGQTVFAAGVLSKVFDVEAENVAADRVITASLTVDAAYSFGDPHSFQVKIKDVDGGGGGGGEEYTGDEWYKAHFTKNAANVYVSRYSRNFLNAGPNFYGSSAHQDYLDYYGELDLVDGQGTRAERTQNWEEYIGGPRSDGPTVIDSNSWLKLYQSDHIRKWWDYATARPYCWLVINCVSMPTFNHATIKDTDTAEQIAYKTPRVTAQQQLDIIADIIAGRKDDDLYMLGRRLRYAVEHENGGSRSGEANAKLVILRVNWEMTHTTSLSIGSTKGTGTDDFFEQMIREGKATTGLDAAKIYRDMMHKWCTQVKAGYSAGWNSDCPAVKLRIALATCCLTQKGFRIKELISPSSYNSTTQSTDDYDIMDMMYHASQGQGGSYQALYDIFYTNPFSGVYGSGKYNHGNSLECAEYWNLPYCTFETGPTFHMERSTSADPWWTDRSKSHPPEHKNGSSAENVGAKHYRINPTTFDVYQCIVPGSGKSTVRPTHSSGEASLTDGYTWVWRFNLGRKLTLVEMSELMFRDFYLLMGSRAAFVGSYNPSSSNDSFSESTWTAYDRDISNDDGKKADWRRFVQMRKACMFGKK